ncbi:response regulator [Microlunatus sp. Y2014]|uniref:response regulator n=1 Tax=Microlunatus sp. Y2014 TaxID=3418488 RepID=UPI003DA7389E
MITVLLVDDDAMVRTGLRMIIGGDEELEVVGEAGDGETGLTMIDELSPDVVLLDIRMPVLDGLGVLERLSELDDAPRVLVLTTFNTDDYVLRALRKQAQGFLLKDADPPEIVAAIKAVHRGDPALSPPAVTATVIAAATDNAKAVSTAKKQLAQQLTGREREVAVLMARGLTNAEIGSRLFLSLATVKANLSRIFTKLDVDNRVSAAMAIRDAGLLDGI